MVDRDALLESARSNPAGLRFVEACRLAEGFGWKLERRKGSHRLYRKSGALTMINLQNMRGAAKPYQVRQLIRAIEELEDL